jgi:hypothetical protein
MINPNVFFIYYENYYNKMLTIVYDIQYNIVEVIK